MTRALLKLEVFETTPLEDEDTRLDAHQVTKLREESFEAGYAAGWQDALEQMRNEDSLRRIAAEEALQAVSFSYAEAHQALSDAFLALTEALLAKLLPEVLSQALPAHLVRELEALVERHTNAPVQIACAPSVRDVLAPYAAAFPDLQIEFIAEPSFTEAQVALRLGAQERVIDLDGLLVALRTAFDAQKQRLQQQESTHG